MNLSEQYKPRLTQQEIEKFFKGLVYRKSKWYLRYISFAAFKAKPNTQQTLDAADISTALECIDYLNINEKTWLLNYPENSSNDPVNFLALQTKLQVAVDRNDLNRVKDLVAKGAIFNENSIKCVSNEINQFLNKQALRNEEFIAKVQNNSLTEKDLARIGKIDGYQVNAISEKYKASALFIATSKNQLEVVEKLLEHGANPNQVSPKNGYNPLLESIDKHNNAIANKLIEYGANPEFVCKNKENKSVRALNVARQKNNIEMVQKLNPNPFRSFLKRNALNIVSFIFKTSIAAFAGYMIYTAGLGVALACIVALAVRVVAPLPLFAGFMIANYNYNRVTALPKLPVVATPVNQNHNVVQNNRSSVLGKVQQKVKGILGY